MTDKNDAQFYETQALRAHIVSLAEMAWDGQIPRPLAPFWAMGVNGSGVGVNSSNYEPSDARQELVNLKEKGYSPRTLSFREEGVVVTMANCTGPAVEVLLARKRGKDDVLRS